MCELCFIVYDINLFDVIGEGKFSKVGVWKVGRIEAIGYESSRGFVDYFRGREEFVDERVLVVD